MTCPWCGDTHRSDQLCQRAQRGMTRRSFCFLFGAGVAAAAVLPSEPFRPWTKGDVERWFDTTIQTGDGQVSFRSLDPRLRTGRTVSITIDGQTLEGVIVESSARIF